MNVLHLPYNISNWTTIHVHVLNKQDGLKAVGLVFGEKSVLHNHDALIYVSQRNKFQKLRSYIIFLKYIMWADVIHWYWDEKIFPNNWALRTVRFFRKPALVEWLGGEIRIPEIEFADNPAYKQEYSNFSESNPADLKKSSLELQSLFRKYDFGVILCPEMEQYLDRNIFPENYLLRQRIELDRFEFFPPSSETNRKIRIVHSPTNQAAKGTSYVVAAIDNLKRKYSDLDFELIYNVPNKQAIDLVSSCDIFLDQFIVGSYGMAALEAMAMGKVVFCYIKESLVNDYPSDLPVINANIWNLEEKIENFLIHKSLLHQIGFQSRAYVEKHHAADELIAELIEIYHQQRAKKEK